MHDSSEPSVTSAARIARNADQERLVRHFAEVARVRLAGEDDAGRRIVGRQPQEVVVLGVMPPRPRDDHPPPPAEVSDLPEEPGVPIDLLPSSEMGLSCLVEPCDTTLGVRAEVHFALYLQHLPTYEEQADFSQAEAMELGSEGEGEGAPTQNVGGHSPNRRRGAGDRVQPVYIRYDIVTDVEVSVPIPEEGDSTPHTERVSLDGAITEAVFGGPRAPATARPGGRYQILSGGQRVPRAVIADGATAYENFLTANADPDWILPVAEVAFTVTIQRSLDARLRVDLSLVNESVRGDRENGFVPELGVYDAGFDASISGGPLVNMGYSVIEHDYRVEPVVYAHGRFCCADEGVDAAQGRLATTTWPVFRQAVYESRADLQPKFEELSNDPVPTLRAIADAMEQFALDWRTYLDDPSCGLIGDARSRCEEDLVTFVSESTRFRRGVELVDTNAWGIGHAFRLMNEAFVAFRSTRPLSEANENQPAVGSWRLFQIVFIVSNLAALAAREADEESDLLDELASADVLWFPTGGGKSDALYGLAAVTMLWDRLRGKTAGTSVLIRFPLRMLSVQQLDRTLRLVAACELVRTRHSLGGEGFLLGYFVGRGNTPNRITDENDSKWHDISAMEQLGMQWRADNVVITVCPYCGSAHVVLDPDTAAVRLWHRCADCERRLPVVISDDEVYRTLPAVLVATVDKLASVAFNAHFSHLTHGPRYRCPSHGYVTFSSGRDARCLARQYCSHPRSDWTRVDIRDPAPALLMQDELHLLAEELGTFAAHYETLFQFLCQKGSGKPPKVLAATATISDYENQVRQLYALRPRRFPSEGFRDGETFYAQRDASRTQRVFVGALPSQIDATDLALRTGLIIRDELERLRGLSPSAVIAEIGLAATAQNEIEELLFAYELQLAYANKKTDADRFRDRMNRAAAEVHPERFQTELLNGQTPLARISAAIRRVESETLAIPPSRRLAVIAGTSLVSHGVDLERLNIEFVLGLPPTMAMYVQATSRAGRSSVGLVVCALGKNYARDRSVYHFFDPTHRYVNSLVEPVALNRFSVHGPKKTAAGLFAALLLCDLSRDLVRLAPTYTSETNFTNADELRNWLAHAPATADNDLRNDLRAAFGLSAPVLDPMLTDSFRDEVDRLFLSLLASIRGNSERLLTRAMRPAPPRSFRDIDASVTFGVLGHYSREKFQLLSRYGDIAGSHDDEVELADEGDAA